MDEFLERQKAIKALDVMLIKPKHGTLDFLGASYNQGVKDCISRIRYMPSCTPPMKTGSWIIKDWAVVCSECGEAIPHLAHFYCPNCGANMGVEQRE